MTERESRGRAANETGRRRSAVPLDAAPELLWQDGEEPEQSPERDAA